MTRRINRAQVILVTLILLCLAYFGGGAVLMKLGWTTKETYLALAGVVGGLASVIGLISLLRSPISQTDVHDLELQSLQKLTDTTKDLKELEAEREKTAAQIGSLEIQKKEMEVLVRKASMSLFLKEQRDHHLKRIRSELNDNKALLEHIQELSIVDEKLGALEEEIEKDPNVEVLKQVMASARVTKTTTLDDIIEDTHSPILKLMLYLVKIVGETSQKLVSIYRID